MRVAFLTPVPQYVGVVVFDLATGKVEPVASARDGDVSYLFWKGNDRIVFGVSADDDSSTPAMIVDIKTKGVQWIPSNYIIDRRPSDPTQLYVFSWDWNYSSHISRVYLNSMRTFPVFGWDPGVGEMEVDGNGVVKYRIRYVGERVTYETRDDDESLWKPMAEFTGDMTTVFPPISFHGFASDNEHAYLSRVEPDGREALYLYTIRSRQWGEPLFRCDGPLNYIHLSPRRDRLEFVAYGTDARQIEWFDNHLAKLIETVRSSFRSNVELRIVNSDDSENVFVLRTYSDVSPPTYYLFDRRGKGQLVELAKSRPALSADQLQPMRPISYHARDGLLIHGFLTQPRNPAGKRVPLIVYPHSDPFGDHDVWGFDPMVQFLVSRGYAVLQPNFRGSSGYGEAFLAAGKHEWGRKMQDDLTDAVKWAVNEGIADPKRICLLGFGYGGYAALAGAVFTPDLYRCTVNIGGPPDLKLVANWRNEMSDPGKAWVRGFVGNDKAFINDCSPVHFVERIKIPTFHAYADYGQWIKPQSWAALERELKKYSKTYEYVSEGKGYVSFNRLEPRLNLYRHMEAFLAKYLPPDDPAGTTK